MLSLVTFYFTFSITFITLHFLRSSSFSYLCRTNQMQTTKFSFLCMCDVYIYGAPSVKMVEHRVFVMNLQVLINYQNCFTNIIVIIIIIMTQNFQP